jgi:hypothetical protein
VIATVVSVAASLTVGFLLGGCTGRDDLSQSLLQRNSQIENQLAAQGNVITCLAGALIITACGLGASLLWRPKKGDRHGAKTKRTETRK